MDQTCRLNFDENQNKENTANFGNKLQKIIELNEESASEMEISEGSRVVDFNDLRQ